MAHRPPHLPPTTARQLFTTTARCAAKKPRRRKRSASRGDKRDSDAKPFERHVELSRLENGLSDEQRAVVDLVLNRGESIFFTGPAGTGKSFLLRKIREGLAIKHLEDRSHAVAVTASTGLAASSIAGTTLHRFAGIGLGKAPTTQLILDIFKDRKGKLARWLDAKVLVVDEISMVDATLFDKLDVIARAVRGVDRPFGGIQLVLTGDFFQLPPVLPGPGDDDGAGAGPRFCFEAEAWRAAVPHTITLTRIYRQQDPAFAAMLNEIREGALSPPTIGAFRALARPLPPGSGAGMAGPEAAELFPLRREADAANERRMRRIKSASRVYFARDGGIIEDSATRKKLLSDCPAAEVLKLKKGAQVMLVKNLDSVLVNGSLGRVVGFANWQTYFHGRWDDPDKDEGDQEFSSVSAEGEGGGGGASEEPGLPEHRPPLYPVVRFRLASGATRTELCARAEWKVERWVHSGGYYSDGYVVETLATRTQVPLILAWALSIHKAQGQTLQLVKVDLARVFETGQAYVALSRATRAEGLQVLNFDPNRVRAHPRVRQFYAGLSRVGREGGVVLDAQKFSSEDPERKRESEME